MDFFEQQERARRQTTLMVALFILSVACIVALVNLVGVGVYVYVTTLHARNLGELFSLTPHHVYFACTGLTLAVIGWGTANRLYELSGGGAAVARLVGARLVRRDSQDRLERRLLNIVEEMAIASGISAPLAYVMDDQSGINAFAAGYSPNEAVVAVTRGALETLNRDELQGVIGHEFSHILNGDMRLNIRLMGVIAGLVGLGSLGTFLMQLGHSSGNDKDKDRSSPLALVGLALWVLGSVGVFFGNLIKASVSRQREFLADASAVQFTRNPDGLGAALYKIGQTGSVMNQRSVGEISHMCIGLPAASFADFEMLNTHPPIEVRITRLLGPGATWLLRDRFKREQAGSASNVIGSNAQIDAVLSEVGASAAAAASSSPRTIKSGAIEWEPASPRSRVTTTSAAVMESVGAPSAEHFDRARLMIAAIPAEVRTGARTPEGALAAICALLLDEGTVRETQLQAVREQAGDAVATAAQAFAIALKGMDPRLRLPLVDLAMPVLKTLESPRREQALALAKTLIDADQRVTLAEFVLLTLLTRHLSGEPKGPPPVKHTTLDTVRAESRILLSLLAHAGRGDAPAYDVGAFAIGLPTGGLLPIPELPFTVVEKALYEMKLLAPMKKPLFIKACLATVMADGRLTVLEGELMRALCAALDSPLPPLLETAETQ